MTNDPSLGLIRTETSLCVWFFLGILKVFASLGIVFFAVVEGISRKSPFFLTGIM